MASKENQMSLDIIAKALPFETYICYIHTLQKAIDDLELYKKALYLNLKAEHCLQGTPPKKLLKQYIEEDTNYYLERAKEELENGK